MRTARAISVTAALVVLPFLAAAPARAAAPGNDLAAFAIPVDLGFSATVDTSEATTDADDVQANAACGAPATDASVWYSFTPATDTGVVVDVASSTFPAGVIVATGSPGSLSLVTCGPDGVFFPATAGLTYTILAFDDQADGGGNGGMLTISIAGFDVPPAPSVSVVVDPIGRIEGRSGTATLTGTLTCAHAFFSLVSGTLSQPVGRFTVSGTFDLGTSVCDGTPQPWSATFPGDNGKFAGGKSAAVAFSFACGSFSCVDGYTTQKVMLRGGKR